MTSCISWSVGRFVPLSSAGQPLANWGPPGSGVPGRLPVGKTPGTRPSGGPGALVLSSEPVAEKREREGAFLVNLEVTGWWAARIGWAEWGSASVPPAGPQPRCSSPVRHGKAGEGIAGHRKAGEGIAGHGKAGEGIAEYGKAGEGIAGHGKAGEGIAGHGKAEEGIAGHGKAEEGIAGYGKAGEGIAGYGKAGEGIAGYGKAGDGTGSRKKVQVTCQSQKPSVSYLTGSVSVNRRCFILHK
uniref:Uncharacterized protein n=1 Tax=Paramormyrops kingsleyae TaxID=1676925 RepID=A0A3B3R4E6_9TELE